MKNLLLNYFKPYRGLPKEIYVIFIARVINAMGVFVFPLLMILMKQELNMTPKESGLIMMIGGFIFTFSSLIGGKFTDTIGRKKVLVIFDSLAALCYIACALTPISTYTLYFIMGAMFCYGLSDPAHGALIADLTNKENRENAFSLTYLGFNLGLCHRSNNWWAPVFKKNVPSLFPRRCHNSPYRCLTGSDLYSRNHWIHQK